VASQLDSHGSLELRLRVGFPRQLRRPPARAALVRHLRVAEELPAGASRAVPSGRGPPGLRDGRVVSPAAQDVDGTQPGQGGTAPDPPAVMFSVSVMDVRKFTFLQR